MLTVGVLGPLDVRRDGRPVTVPAGRTTEVLVRLALDAGQVVSAERLIDDLWGPAAATTGRNTLQSKVSQLRRALGEPDRLISGHGGYVLDIDPDRVDALRVVVLATAAAEARRAGDASTALDVTAEALALFRGDLLVDAGDGDWLHPHRARLDELRLALVEDQAAALVELGGGGGVIADLEALTASHPLREGLWASLITALYRAGRQADALAAYQRLRRLLDDELGVEPGPQLQELESRILRQSVAPAASVARPVPDPMIGNLPTLTTPLVGRAEDVEALGGLVDARHLVTVVGPAGVGKTRLAIETGRSLRPAGGVWLIRLDAVPPMADRATITRSIAETLGLTGGERHLVDRLAADPTVLVLDTCEHLVEQLGGLVTELLDRVPMLRLLATSQSPLGLDGETVHVLNPLSPSDSVLLFGERAKRSRPQFTLDEETNDLVRSVCASLDGLPLAIELAAARARSLSVHDISRRLDDRFTLLRDPSSRLPVRRRALAAAIGWSYDLLFPDDQRGLWALATFVGGAPLAAAEHVLAALDVPAAVAVDVIDRLVDRSVAALEPTEGGQSRYRLLDSIRAYALDRLDEAGLRVAAQAAHAAWFAQAGELAAATVRTGAQPDCVRLVRVERANIDAALAWTARHDPQLGLRIANGFGWTWVVLGDGVAGAWRIRSALHACGAAAGDHERATALLTAGWLEASAGNVERAQQDLDAAIAAAGRIGDRRLLADGERHLAFLRIQQGRPTEVMVHSAAAVAVYRQLGIGWETAAGLLLGAFGSIMLGDARAASRDAEEAVALLRAADDSWGLVHAQAMLGAVADAEHRFDDATSFLERAVARSEALGFLGQVALHLTTLGRVRQRAGRQDQAVDVLTRAVAAAGRAGDLRIAATARIHLARAHRTSGDLRAARDLLEQNEAWYHASGAGGGALVSRAMLAAVTAADAEADAAESVTSLLAVVEDARSAHDHEAEVVALDALACRAAQFGDRAGAARLLRTADEIAAQIGHVLDRADRVDATAAHHAIRSGP